MAVHRQRLGGTRVVALAGEFDLASHEQVREALLAELRRPGADSLVADLAAVNFMDSSALSALVAVHRAATARSSRFTVHNPSVHVARVLEATGLLHLLTS